MKIFENSKIKVLRSPDYNFDFDKSSGFFARWGNTAADDPQYSPYGCEIIDMEISTACHGIGKPCGFCYKSNTPKGEYTTFATFKVIFDKLTEDRVPMQIAFGIGDIDANPDQWKIFDHCREQGVIPNITINGARMTPELFDKLARVMGAVSVSHYDDDICFNAVQELTNRGMNQVNIHKLLCRENYDNCLTLIDKATTDPRLKGLNAIVFLALKPKGRGTSLTPMRDSKAYRKLVDYAMENKVGVGFDSCSFTTYAKAMEGHPDYDRLIQLGEGCESWIFSNYINVLGKMYPCSFCEKVEQSIDLLNTKEKFIDIWNGPVVQAWRNKLLKNCRNCPVYNVGPEKDK